MAHPERQHSHQLAVALQQAGLLGRYIHGAPLPPKERMAVPGDKRTRLMHCRLGRHLSQAVLSRPAQLAFYYRLLRSFDWMISRYVGRSGYAGVVAYENSARDTFRAAKSAGMTCILDHASVHFALQDRMITPAESKQFHSRVIARKHEELELADYVLACSTLAANSFIQAGTAPEKIKVVPLGCDIGEFTPAPTARPLTQMLRFLFVGRLNRLKGADLLAAAANELCTEGVPFELTVVASLHDADADIVSALRPRARLLGKVPHHALPEIYRAADCVIAPSRFDSFCMVVAEALACGVPVITTANVGARDLVADDVSGWILPADDASALAERMRWCVAHLSEVRSMRAAARSAVGVASWSRYGNRVSEEFTEILDRRRAGFKAV